MIHRLKQDEYADLRQWVGKNCDHLSRLTAQNAMREAQKALDFHVNLDAIKKAAKAYDFQFVPSPRVRQQKLFSNGNGHDHSSDSGLTSGVTTWTDETILNNQRMAFAAVQVFLITALADLARRLGDDLPYAEAYLRVAVVLARRRTSETQGAST